MSQMDFMHKDECIVIDQDDNVIGHKSKYETHVFNAENVSISSNYFMHIDYCFIFNASRVEFSIEHFPYSYLIPRESFSYSKGLPKK